MLRCEPKASLEALMLRCEPKASLEARTERGAILRGSRILSSGRPKLQLMDEPPAGMAPRERAALMELTATIARERRIGVLFTEHDMGAVFAHADRILVLVRGEIIAAGRPETVRGNARVREVYLGGGAGPGMHRQAG